MTESSTQRKRFKERREAERRRGQIIWGLVGIAVLGLVGWLVWNSARPAEGLAIPTAEANHLAEGTDPGEYNSNPPTSGPHYDSPMPGGFYEPEDLEQFGPYPLGYAVHSLEHGYIVFWYNCDLLSETECADLKADIGDYLDSSLNAKLIAYPWQGSDAPLVLTSWGYMLEMQEFNSRDASAFISANRLRAPEPNAP